MKVTLLTQYFPPESGSASIKMFELAEYLSDKGHKVTVLTAFPNYPLGKLYEGYSMKLLHKECRNGIRIVRTPLYIAKNRYSFKERMLYHTSFMITSIYGGFFSGNTDLIYYYSPPLFLGFTAAMLGRVYNVPVVGEFNDMWPQAAIHMGVIKNKLIKNIAFKFERFVYKHTNYLFFYSHTHRNTVISQGVPIEKTEIHPLWVSSKDFDINDENFVKKIIEKYHLKNKFVIMYTGYIGKAQGLDILVEAASLLANFDDIRIVLIGGGPEKMKLEAKAKHYNLKNILFIPFQPKNVIPHFMKVANVLFASLKLAPHREGTIPAKVLSYMMAGRPVVVVARGETERLMRECECGFAVNREDALELMKTILELYKHRESAIKMGECGKKYALMHFEKEKVLKNIEDRLNEISRR